MLSTVHYLQVPLSAVSTDSVIIRAAEIPDQQVRENNCQLPTTRGLGRPNDGNRD